MFTTFVGKSQPTRPKSTGATPSLSAPRKSKRVQVARACDWCRVHRIKCDSNYPCKNCHSRGGQCSNKRANEARTLPQAFREIESLRAKIKELEGQLEERDQLQSISKPLGSLGLDSNSLLSQELDSSEPIEGSKVCGEGIYTRTARSQQTQWYGPSSSFYFIGQMSTYLRSAIHVPILDDHLLPNSMSRTFASPIYSKKVILEDNTWTTDASAREEYLTGLQEEYFLDMFWQSYHCTYQILNEAEFKAHYKSLWAPGSHSRKPSALVDIVLAICMQYGVAFINRKGPNTETKTNIDVHDATIAGRWYYHRCQTLLTAELESPSISTLQCHILSVVYLCNASFQNMAHTTLAVAIRTAHILGLHLEAPKSIPRSQCELRKRIWWTLYAVESKTCLKLGRPISAQLAHMTCSLPADDHELAATSGSEFAPVDQDVTWLTYGIQLVKLILAAQATYASWNDRCADLLREHPGETLCNSHHILETSADSLTHEIKRMKEWRDNVPDGLKTKRKDEGEPFSTDHSSLEVGLFASLWLQRQRVYLELLYHNLMMNLYRPFICFTPFDHSSMPKAERNSIKCIEHAMAITTIMHQTLHETEIVHGWREAFQWQWNATLSTVGFILAYPHHEYTTMVRESMDTVVEVLESFGKQCAMAASAAALARDLVAKADFLISRSNGPAQSADMSAEQSLEHLDLNGSSLEQDNLLQPDTIFSTMESDEFSGLMDFAFANSFEWLSAETGNTSDTWTFTH
ncbi:related to transcription activator protein acu-15 [Phialocephala subalpina]|uniref:Related to transcription activator protein acu-15 n=1 Tax=Phialocephala subalpina TaxID=576137 RepID=A0A1L7X6K9_9HELO|nr:related to transcription activator protein acu-15 [Phialocephala subalpina]